jgi:hypothetical protein
MPVRHRWLSVCLWFPCIAGAQSVWTDGFEVTPAAEGQQVAEACDVEGVMPPGWVPVFRSWGSSFSSPDLTPFNAYPKSASWPAPIGADIGSFRVVGFTPRAGETVVLHFDDVQPNLSEGYSRSHPADGMWFAISPCPGDLRPPDDKGSAFLRPGCRMFEVSASLVWSTSDRIGSDNESACKLEAGQTYYLTVAPVDPRDGLQWLENTCLAGETGCDVGVVTATAH